VCVECKRGCCCDTSNGDSYDAKVPIDDPYPCSTSNGYTFFEGQKCCERSCDINDARPCCLNGSCSDYSTMVCHNLGGTSEWGTGACGDECSEYWDTDVTCCTGRDSRTPGSEPGPDSTYLKCKETTWQECYEDYSGLMLTGHNLDDCWVLDDGDQNPETPCWNGICCAYRDNGNTKCSYAKTDNCCAGEDGRFVVSEVLCGELDKSTNRNPCDCAQYGPDWCGESRRCVQLNSNEATCMLQYDDSNCNPACAYNEYCVSFDDGVSYQCLLGHGGAFAPPPPPRNTNEPIHPRELKRQIQNKTHRNDFLNAKRISSEKEEYDELRFVQLPGGVCVWMTCDPENCRYPECPQA